MRTSLRPAFVGILALLVSLTALGQTVVPVGTAGGTKFMPLSEVKEGAKAVARTVFRGTKSEEFNVEILGVVPGSIGPHQDMIIGRLSGGNADRTFVFAGMSGSPVYIDGKLIGALSYSFPFSKEPICGITPIEQMVSIFEQVSPPKGSAAGTVAYTQAELRADTWRSADARGQQMPGAIISGMAADSRLMAVAGQTFVPISTPMTFSGVSQSTLDKFAPELARGGILPVAAAGGTSAMTDLKPANESTLLGGDSVVVSLARGDISISAAGTVTLRDGQKIYAFGHPYFSLGTADLPMSESHVVVVIPNINNSFKLAVPDAMVGAMTQDRATGIYGSLGRSPKLIPVKIAVTTSRGRAVNVNFESGIDEFLTPLIVNVGVQNSLSSNERGIGDSTIEVSGEITVAGEKSIRLERRFAGPQAAAFAAATPVVPLALLLKSNFDGLNITGVNVNVKVSDGAKTATLDRLTTDRTQAHAGETLALTAFYRTDSGRVITQNIPVTIPKDAAPGAVSIIVGDGNALQERSSAQQFVPKTAAELIATINSLKRSDRMYAFATRTSAGAIIGSSEMPSLPPSFLATLNSDRSAGGSKPTVQTVLIDQELPPLEYLVTGQQTLAIEIVR